MVIQGINNGSMYFSADIGDIKISNVSGTLGVKYIINSTNTISEKYYADSNGNVTIKDIAKLVEAYYNFPIYGESTTEYTLDAATVQMTCTDSSGSVSVSFKMIYSNAKVNCNPDECHFFLSRYRLIKTNKQRIEFITLFKTGSVKLITGVAYINSGKAKFKKITLALSTKNDCCYTRLVSLKSIASLAGININDVLFYELYLYVSDILTDKIRYEIDTDQKPSDINFLYRNLFGGFETVSFSGYMTDTPEISASVDVLLDKHQRHSISLKDSHKAYSGFVNAEKYNAIRDMLLSPVTYLLNKNFQAEEIIISESDMERTTPSSEAFGISVSYYPAYQASYGFTRDNGIKDRIFDKTFDHTFD